MEASNAGSGYTRDILAQPHALLDLATELEKERGLGELAKAFAGGSFDRVVLSGMGASWHALYPAFIQLSGAGIPASWVESSELLFGLRGFVTGRTLLVLASQSGESAEVTGLLDTFAPTGATPTGATPTGATPKGATPKGATPNGATPNGATVASGKPFVVGLTNDPLSSLARRSDLALMMTAGSEYSVSTRTFMNSLALGLDLALGLCGRNRTSFHEDCRVAAISLEGWFADWESRKGRLKAAVGLPRVLYYVGRGPSLAAVLNGALITKESAKFPAQGSSSAAFRHGPFELVDAGCVVLVFAGKGRERDLNLRLAADVAERGGRAFLLDAEAAEGIPLIEIASGPSLLQPLFEIAAVELLTLGLAELTGFPAGEFRNSGKVTRVL